MSERRIGGKLLSRDGRETADCFLLAAMAYDRYVAICNPLLYHTTMSKKHCVKMTTGAFIARNLHSMIHVGFLFRLTFCRSHQINHLFCDILLLYRLSCGDPYINELMIFIFSGLIQTFTITIVIIAYLFILFTIFHNEIQQGKRQRLIYLCIPLSLCLSILWISSLHEHLTKFS